MILDNLLGCRSRLFLEPLVIESLARIHPLSRVILEELAHEVDSGRRQAFSTTPDV